jgi:enamine deaminase RidA (YjgF/YER057c/UK114 family)
MTGVVEQRLSELGIALPPAPAALAAYVPAVLIDGWVYTAGQLPMMDGALLRTGVVGDDVTTEDAAECARVCALNGLAAIKSVIGDLDRIERIVKITGFVASAPGYSAQPVVVNGASELLGSILGPAGVHARSAVGAAALPLNAPVEVEIIARIGD